LLEKLGDRHFVDVPQALRADILRFYGGDSATLARSDDDDERKLHCELSQLAASHGK
jgi:hypothetical protein